METHFARGRIARSCTECARRKIKCDHEYPCGSCTRRGQNELCIPRDSGLNSLPNLSNVDRDKLALQQRVAMLEARLGDCSSRRSTHTENNPEGLLVMLENVSLGQPPHIPTLDKIIAPLYQPGKPVFLMLMPDRKSSEHILDFSLANTAWMHCAVRGLVFQNEHDLFWESIDTGDKILFENDHAWLSIYFSLLAVGFLYMDPQERPGLPRLSEIANYTDDMNTERDNGYSIARMWYETAVKELEASSPLTEPNLRVVQTVAILNLVHSHFGKMDQQYILLGMAINTARALDMHLLASEERFSERLALQPSWSTPEDRQFGRRLWWALVISDWLGMFTRPSSITPSSFNTLLSPQSSDKEDLLLTDAGSDTQLLPLRYYLTISQLASVIYTHVKAPRDPSSDRFSQVLNQLETIERANFRPNDFLSVNPPDWMAIQQYLISHNVQLISVTIGRASLVLWLMGRPDTEPIIQKGLSSALKIIATRQQPISRLAQCHWVVATATLAAGVYVALYLICFKATTPPSFATELRGSIQYCLEAIKHPNPSTSLATHGAKTLERLLQVELYSPSDGCTEKGMLISILKMAFQPDGFAFDPSASVESNMPPSDLFLDEVDMSWPTMVNDLGLDEFLPNLYWDLAGDQPY